MSLQNYITLGNKEAVIASLKSLEGDVQARVVKGFDAAGKTVRNALRDSLAESSNEDAASAPGGKPLSQTGNLKSKIQATVQPLMIGEPITLKIYVTMKGFYGRMLEFGTSKMAARPWFYSGIKEQFPFLKDTVETALSAEIKRRNSMARSASVSRAKGELLREARDLFDSKQFFRLRLMNLNDMQDALLDKAIEGD